MKPCNQCGKCCELYGARLTATADEIAWWEIFRPEIARYTHDGQIWRDPVDHQPLTRCPWLNNETDAAVFSCTIYHDRPEDCRHYPVTLAEMARDGCEMLEVRDLDSPTASQRALDMLMSDSRPPLN